MDNGSSIEFHLLERAVGTHFDTRRDFLPLKFYSIMGCIKRNNLPKGILVELILGLLLFGTVPRSFLLKTTIFGSTSCVRDLKFVTILDIGDRIQILVTSDGSWACKPSPRSLTNGGCHQWVHTQ